MKKTLITILLFVLCGLNIFSFLNFDRSSHTAYADDICWIWDDCYWDDGTTDSTTAPDKEVPITDDFSQIQTPSQRLSEIGGEGEYGISSFNTGQHPDAPADYAAPGVGAITSPIYFGIDLFKYIISGIALIVIAIMAVKLIVGGSEEEYSNAKNGLIMGLLGFLIIQIADVSVKKIFFGETGEVLGDLASAKAFAEAGSQQIRGIVGGMNLFLGSVAILTMVIRGYTVLTGMGEEEELTKAKSHIYYAIIGLVMVGLSDIIVRGFIFPKNGTVLPDANAGKRIIVMLTNYLSGFIAVLAFAALFYGGYQYVVSSGSDDSKETFKKILISVVIALLISAGAYAIVNTLISL